MNGNNSRSKLRRQARNEDHRDWEEKEKETEADTVLSLPQTSQNLWNGLCEIWGQIAQRR